MKVLIYNEFIHEREDERAKRYYEGGIHECLKKALGEIDDSLEFTVATLEDHKEVITEERLNETDVMIYWGHVAHGAVDDEVVNNIYQAVNKGMGLIVLHSGHESKIFQKLMGTRCSVHWREACENGNIWILDETHPIVRGVSNPIKLEAEETYSEPFDIPVPDELLGITWWKGGEVFRGMNLYRRGHGKIFYFHPGHETLPSYHNKDVIRVIYNALYYCLPVKRLMELTSSYRLPEEKDIREAIFQAPEDLAATAVTWDHLKDGTVKYIGEDHAHTWKTTADK